MAVKKYQNPDAYDGMSENPTAYLLENDWNTKAGVGTSSKISFDPASEFATSQPGIDLYNPYTGNRNVEYTQLGNGYSDFSNLYAPDPPDNNGGDKGNGGGGGGTALPELPVYNSVYGDRINGIVQSIANGSGNYNLPSDYQSKYSADIDGLLQRIMKDNDTPYDLPTWNEQFSYDPYNSKYQGTINDLANQIANRKFEYNYRNDPMYQQMEQSYTRNGQRAMQDTLGQMAARTGGLASSYAGSAAQQSYNNYMMNLADRIPELQKLAYSMYQDEGNNMRNNLSMYQGLEGTDYSRYKDAYNMASNEYDRRYNQFNDDWNKQYTTQRDERNNTKDALSILQGLENNDYGRWQDQYNNSMNLYNQQQNDYYKLLNLYQGLEDDEYNKWKQQNGIK